MHLTDDSLPAYLIRRGLAPAGEMLVVEPAGDGNINWVRRVRAPARGTSWIVKQARPALERFPQYHASTERILFEARWFEIARPLDRERVCPRVLDLDSGARVLVLEDLGDAERLDHALGRGADVVGALEAIARLLGAIHAAAMDGTLAGRFRNDEMQRLHGEHIFVLPYRANDFPLSPRLRARAAAVQGDTTLVALADAAWTRYLEPRGTLLHGDVQAGNVLLGPEGPKLLDAEIAHVGDPAFDVGTLVAHVLLAAVGRGAVDDLPSTVGALWRAYAGAAGPAAPAFATVARQAGFEIMRRTIGAARVTAVASDEAGLAAVDLATRLIAHPPEVPPEA